MNRFITYTKAAAAFIFWTWFAWILAAWLIPAVASAQFTPPGCGVPCAISKGGTGQTSKTAAFDALAPTTTQGDTIYYNGTDNVRLAKGTAGQVLKMNGGATAPEWGAAGSGAWTLVDTASPSGATTTGALDFSGLGSYVLYIQGMTVSVDGEWPVLWFTEDSGSAWTVPLDHYSHTESGTGSQTRALASTVGVPLTVASTTWGIGNAGGEYGSWKIEIDVMAAETVIRWQGGHVFAAGTYGYDDGVARSTVTSTLDALRVTVGTGTMSGTFNLYETGALP